MPGYDRCVKHVCKSNELEDMCLALPKKLFGEGYSGLEYDYRGLVRLYTQKGDYAQADHYRDIINQWSVLRDTQNAREVHFNHFAGPFTCNPLNQRFGGFFVHIFSLQMADSHFCKLFLLAFINHPHEIKRTFSRSYCSYVLLNKKS